MDTEQRFSPQGYNQGPMGPGPYGIPMNSVQPSMGAMHGPPNRGGSMIPPASNTGMRLQMLPGGRGNMGPASMQGMQQANGSMRPMHMGNMGNQRMGLSMSSGSVSNQRSHNMNVQSLQSGVQNLNLGGMGSRQHVPGMGGMPVGDQHLRMQSVGAQMMPGPGPNHGFNGNAVGGNGGGSSGVAVGSGGNFGPGGMHGQSGQQMEGVNFDMASDFPALGNQSESQRELAAKRQADYKLQSKEDFPALGGGPGGQSGRDQGKDDNGGYNFPPQANYANGGPQQSSGIGMRNAQFDHFMNKGQTSSTQASQSTQPSSQGSVSNASREHTYGLLGLLGVIRMTDADLNTLALGTDLTALGLNLNSPNCLYNSFLSPFADSPSHRDPEFALPRCYSIQAPMQPPVVKIHCFSEETLFYIFYSMPKDQIQLVAAIELYNRDWRYHKRLQRWFTRAAGAAEPVVKTNSYETGSYIYFEPSTWEKLKKEGFTLVYDDLEERARVHQGQHTSPQNIQQGPQQAHATQASSQKPLRSSIA